MIGFKTGLPHAEYLEADGISNSDCGKILQSPAHWMEWKRNPIEPTPQMALGTATHVGVLEPDEFSSRYIVAPDGIDRRTKAGKESWAAFLVEAEGKTILTAEQSSKIDGMAAAVARHPAAGELLDNGIAEVSAFWKDGFTGLDCKCRPDWTTVNTLVDLKTTTDASPEGFVRSIAKFGYHRQAAFYLDGHAALNLPKERFVFIAVESLPPYAVGVYELDEVSLDVGRIEYESALNRFAACIESGEWPAYADGCRTLTLPAWVMRNGD